MIDYLIYGVIITLVILSGILSLYRKLIEDRKIKSGKIMEEKHHDNWDLNEIYKYHFR
jgi:hypothetical protein